MAAIIPSTGLKQGERLLWQGRPSIKAFTGRIILGIILLLLGGVPFVGFIFALLGLIVIAVAVVKARASFYFVTNMRVLEERRLIGHTIKETTLDKITDIVFHQGLMGRLLNYGAIHFSTAGTGFLGIDFRNASDPMTIRGIVINAKDEYVKKAGP